MNWLKSTKTKALGVWLVCLTFCACNHAEEQYKTQLQQALEQQSPVLRQQLTSKEMLVIIPRSGCSGCIGAADQYFEYDFYDRARVQVLFTKISSFKQLHLKFGEALKQDYVSIDSANHFSRSDLNSMYPVIAYLKDGQVSAVEFLSPDNRDVLQPLTEKL